MTRSLAFAFAFAALAACGGKPAAAPPSTTASETSPAKTTIASFTVDPATRTEDKISGSDGAFHPDGGMDLVFAAQIEGPFKALFLIETDETGKPVHDYMANTLVGKEPAPKELGGILEHGKFTPGIAVFEGGQLVNEPKGSLGEKGIGPGRHALRLFINDDPRLGKNGHMQLMVLTPDSTLLKGPVIPY